MSERPNVHHTKPLEERLADEAKQLRNKAKKLPRGVSRESMLRKAEQDETAIQMCEWLRPGKRNLNSEEAAAVYELIFAGQK